jgi:hypothetical protein
VNIAKFWGVFFFLMSINYISRIIIGKKGIGPNKTNIIDKLIITLLPILCFVMWKNDSISVSAKVINTIVWIASFASGVWFLLLRRNSSNLERDKGSN